MEKDRIEMNEETIMVGDIVTWRYHDSYPFNHFGYISKCERLASNAFIGANFRYTLTPFSSPRTEMEGKDYVFFDNEYGLSKLWVKCEELQLAMEQDTLRVVR